MEKLLQAALASDLPTGQVVRWLEGDDGALHLQQDIYTDLAPGSSACLRREAFETFLLNYVRDQAELILSTAEKRTAGSRGGTPQPTDATTAPSSEAAPGKTKAKSKLGEKDLHRLESVARRLEPGAVDDNNFPALGAPATKRLTPVAIAPAHVKRLVAANATDSTSGTGTSGGNTPKRRIVPTTVKEVEVSKDFVTAPLATSRPSTPQQAFGSFETAQRQGVSGQLDADWLASSVAHLESRLSAATIDAPPSPSEPHDRGPSSIKSSQNHGTGGQAPAKDAGTAGKGASDAVGMDLQSPDTAGTAVFTHESFREGGRAAEMDASLATIEGRRAPARAAVEEAHSQAGSVAPMPASPQVKLPSPDATSAAASPAGRPAPVALSPSAATLAQLHGAVLRTSTAAPLSEEIELLLNLLAVPVEVEVDAALASAPHLTVLLWCGTLAQQYAALVLHHAGHLVRALGVQLLESICSAQVLVGDAATRSAAVRSFREGAQSALAELRSQQLRSEKAYDSVRAFGAAGSLFGLPAFTSDARKSKSPDEQRRLSNREATRDAWFALMRDTAAKTASFGHSGGRGGSMGTASLASGMDHAGGGEEPDGVVLGRLQARASDLLRALRPDNFGPFAELFTAAVLQAAATGEALLDEELTNLAKRNVDRFHSLNRRMQGQGQGPGPRRGSALQGQQQRRPPHGFGDLGGSAALKPAAKGKRPSSAGGGGGAFGGYVASDEAVTAALEVVAEFPRPLRLHALFLEAADSHRLNTNLVRVMSARLRALNASSSSSNGQDPFAAQPLGERAVASAALAAFLGYLTFTKCSTNTSTPEVLPSGSTGRSGPGGGLPSGHAVDVLCALRSAEEDGTMLRTLPWVTRYLRFLKKDPHAARAPYFRETLELLARLRSLPQLTPGHPSFSLGALCLRSLLEDFAANVPLPSRDRQKRLPETSTQMYRDRDAMHASSEQESGANGGAVAGGMILAAGDAWVDARYIELTCPVLTQARSLFSSAALPGLGVDGVESAAGAAGMRPRPGPPKKIRPTAPLSTAAAPQLPANVTAAHAAARDAVKLRLQRAFLEQYSGEEHRVKLKDVVEYASDVIAATAAASAVHAVMPSAIEAAAAQLHEAVAQHAASLTGPEAPGAQLAQGQRPLIMKSSTSSDAAITQFALAAAEGAITATTERVAAAAYDHAVEEIRLRAAHAMLGLTAPELGEAVVSTAAAIVAEAAQTACGERLIGLAQSQVREALTRQAQSAAKAVLKATSRKSGAGDGGTAPGLSAPVL